MYSTDNVEKKIKNIETVFLSDERESSQEKEKEKMQAEGSIVPGQN